MDATAVPKCPAVSDSRRGFWPIPTSLASSVYSSRGTKVVSVGSAVSLQTMQGMLQKILNSSCTTAPFCKGSVWQFKRLVQSSGFWSEACQFCTNIWFNNPRGSWMLPLFPSALQCPTVGVAFGPFLLPLRALSIRPKKPKQCLLEVQCLFRLCKGCCKRFWTVLARQRPFARVVFGSSNGWFKVLGFEVKRVSSAKTCPAMLVVHGCYRCSQVPCCVQQ